MDTTLTRTRTLVDVPLFSYTGIAHTFRNSPFNEYGYAMAQLKWFTSSFDPIRQDLKVLGISLRELARINGNFTYLQVSDAGRIDDLLDAMHLGLVGTERNATEFGPLEPGLGKWVIDDDYHERHSVDLPFGVDRPDLLDRVSLRLRLLDTQDAAFDDIYLYPPTYAVAPGEVVGHTFRIFGHTRSGDRISAGNRLHEAVEQVLAEIRAETP